MVGFAGESSSGNQTLNPGGPIDDDYDYYLKQKKKQGNAMKQVRCGHGINSNIHESIHVECVLKRWPISTRSWVQADF